MERMYTTMRAQRRTERTTGPIHRFRPHGDCERALYVMGVAPRAVHSRCPRHSTAISEARASVESASEPL